MNRRNFMFGGAAAAGGAAVWAAGRRVQRTVESAVPRDVRSGDKFPAVEARFYEKLENNYVKCGLCPWGCVVADGGRGRCGVRENRGGTYYTLVHSRVCSAHVDPIEKKPLFHFMPGTKAFSVATAGCNLECLFCQNWQISQAKPEELDATFMPPEKCADLAKRTECRTIAYTYSEPTVFHEYMYDCASEGRKLGIRNVMISNGFQQREPMEKLLTVLDGVKIDFKAFTEKYYRETCNGRLKPVLDTLLLLKEKKMWFEMVMLVVPTLNDDRNDITAMCEWIVDKLGPDVPIHFTRFHPEYKLRNLPRTPVKTIEMARQVAIDAGIHYAYLGNVPQHEGENTYCPGCGEMLIRRVGYIIRDMKVKDGKCPVCNVSIAGVWS